MFSLLRALMYFNVSSLAKTECISIPLTDEAKKESLISFLGDFNCIYFDVLLEVSECRCYPHWKPPVTNARRGWQVVSKSLWCVIVCDVPMTGSRSQFTSKTHDVI